MKKLENLPVVFYFPWEEPSGGPVYFTAIARAVADVYPAPIYYTDYEPGLSDSMLQNSSVRKIIVSKADYSIGMSGPVILVTPVYWADRIPPLHPESRILFVNWHNLCIPVLHSTWGISPAQLQTFLTLLHDTNSVAYCDAAHRAAQEAFGVPTHPTYIPIGTELTEGVRRDYQGKSGQLRLAVLGRLVIDKVFSVTNLARLLDAYPFEGEKVLHVIGDGPERHRIRPEDYPNITLVMPGSIFNSALQEYLDEHVDALFAMGTSVLVSGRMAIPSIVVCNEIHEYFDDVFVYLHKSTGAMLGWQVHQAAELELAPMTLATILDEIRDCGRREEIGRACLEYVQKVHSIGAMAESFLQAIAGSRLTVSDFNKTFHPDMLAKVESLNFGPLGQLRILKRSDGVRVVSTGNGKTLALVPRKGPKRVVWRIIKPLLTLPLMPALVLRKTKSFKRSIAKFAEVNERTLQTNEMVHKLSRQIAQTEVAIERFGEEIIPALKSDIDGHARMYPSADIIPSASFEAFAGDVTRLYLDLVKDVDTKSRAILTRTLRRLRQYAETGSDIFQTTLEEDDEYRQLIDYHYNRILPLSDGWFLYDATWFLPSSEISSTVFFYKHFLPDLEAPERLQGCDVLDIGAHMGDSAIVFNEMTNGVIWSLEPSPSNFSLLEKTIARNNLLNVRALRIAVGDEEGETAILELGDMSKIGNGNDGKKVKLTTVDALVTKHGITPGLIKLDVEGSEMRVLAGAEQTIRSHRPVLLISIYHNFDQFFMARKWVEGLGLGYRFKLRKPADRGVAIDLNLICEPDPHWSISKPCTAEPNV